MSTMLLRKTDIEAAARPKPALSGETGDDLDHLAKSLGVG